MHKLFVNSDCRSIKGCYTMKFRSTRKLNSVAIQESMDSIIISLILPKKKYSFLFEFCLISNG